MNIQIKKLVQYYAIVFLVVCGSVFVYGDDLNPPAYRGDPLSVHAHWQLVPGTVILDLTDFSFVDDTDPGTTLDPLPPSNPVDPIADPTGAGKAYQFDLPNWIDDLPVKHMRIQLTWEDTGAPPVINGLSGIDSSGAVVVNPVYSSAIVPGNDPFTLYQYHDFALYPNPDAERWLVTLPDNVLLTQVVADTVSTVPEPATIILLGLGSLLLRKKC